MPDCDKMLDLISARLDGPLSAEQETVLEGHLAGCPACRALQADLQLLHAALGEEAAHPAPPPPELLEGVLAQIRAEQVMPPSKRRVQPWRSWAAMAAVFAVVVAGAAGIKFLDARGGMGATAGSGTDSVMPLQATPEQFTNSVTAAAPDAGGPPAEAVSSQAVEKTTDSAYPQAPTNQAPSNQDPPAAADSDTSTGEALPTVPPASPYLPAGSAAPPLASVLPQPALRSGLSSGEGGVDAYAEQSASPENTRYCGILTLTWSDTLELSSLSGLPYTQTNGIRSYLLPAAEFEALVQANAGSPDASLSLEGDQVDITAEQGLFIVTGVPEPEDQVTPASPAP